METRQKQATCAGNIYKDCSTKAVSMIKDLEKRIDAKELVILDSNFFSQLPFAIHVPLIEKPIHVSINDCNNLIYQSLTGRIKINEVSEIFDAFDRYFDSIFSLVKRKENIFVPRGVIGEVMAVITAIEHGASNCIDKNTNSNSNKNSSINLFEKAVYLQKKFAENTKEMSSKLKLHNRVLNNYYFEKDDRYVSIRERIDKFHKENADLGVSRIDKDILAIAFYQGFFNKRDVRIISFDGDLYIMFDYSYKRIWYFALNKSKSERFRNSVGLANICFEGSTNGSGLRQLISTFELRRELMERRIWKEKLQENKKANDTKVQEALQTKPGDVKPGDIIAKGTFECTQAEKLSEQQGIGKTGNQESEIEKAKAEIRENFWRVVASKIRGTIRKLMS